MARPKPANLARSQTDNSFGLALVCLLLLIGHLADNRVQAMDKASLEFFEKRIRPVLVQHCYECHSGASKNLKGQLRLDTKSGWQQGGESGSPAITPGKPDTSPLIKAIRHDDDVSAMPPKGKPLPKSVVADLTKWVEMGAPDPRVDTPSTKSTTWDDQLRERAKWWSLQPAAAVQAPRVPDNNWSMQPVDRFVLSALRSKKLTPAKDADALTLLRRMSFVLTGLPPKSELVELFPRRFEKDPEAAMAQLVDTLLDSPHFGERIARHWMDVVRYTDTYGYEWDNPAKGSWEYRDYLIRAFNQDVGFDQLVREQIAGDLLPTPRIDESSGLNESLIGPMFYHMGEHRHGDNTTINGVREEMVDNKIDAFSKAFLAMTVACARCHDHKLDAVSQKDYYALAGVFMTPRWTSRAIDSPGKNKQKTAELKRLRAEIRDRVAKVWVDDAGRLADGKALREWAISNRESIAKAELGDVEWLLNQVLAGTAWQEIAAAWRTQHESRTKANAAKFTRLADFAEPGFPSGWVVDGAGVQTGYVKTAEPLISLQGASVVRQILPRGYHTHALSSKLAGAVRLPDQGELPGKHVSVSVAGGEWSGYLRIADNGFQTETVKFLKQAQPTWHTLTDMGAANGIQRVAYELATSDLNPNFPPRTGVAKAAGTVLPNNDEGFDKRSWFSITGVVSHDQPGTPADELQHFAALFDAESPADTNSAWKRIAEWLTQSVRDFKSRQADDDDTRLVNWLLHHKLLTNSCDENAELAKLLARYREVEQSLPFPRSANSMDERGVTPINYAINIRGDINTRGDRVPRDFLAVFDDWHDVGAASGSGRLRLARFLTDERHALVARVYVNRVWQWVFGRGLVRTPNDFGQLGERPSHPELLDYLTREFIQDGWSTKRLIRRLMLSRTFRQSGNVDSKQMAIDPSNRWWHHYPTRRLEAEAIRDSLLFVSGRLDDKLFGRPINPRRFVEDSKKRLFSGPLDGNGRRSIYLEVSIMDRSKFLQSFNAPDPKLPTGRRDVTNVPAQALVLLNDPFVIAMAQHWAERLVKDGSGKVEDRVRSMFVTALAREPTAKESARWQLLVKGLAPQTDNILADMNVWKNTAHTLFNTQEFIHYR